MPATANLSVIRMIGISLFGSAMLFLPTTGQTKPVACFDANVGNFCMELFDRQAPQTVSNFIRYIDNGAYNSGVFHRSVPGFVVQAGGHRLLSNANGTSLNPVAPFAPVANEFGASNTRGTVAMAKVASDPNSATSQWFVNLSDNAENLDNQNGGFTVFAKVLYDGMAIFDAIAALSTYNLAPSFGAEFSATPTISVTGQEVRLAVINSVQVLDVTAVFDNDRVTFPVDIGNNGLYDITMRLIASHPAIVFKVESAIPIAVADKPANIARFSYFTNQLTIPSAQIDPSTIVNNVRMSLSNAEELQFTVTGSN